VNADGVPGKQTAAAIARRLAMADVDATRIWPEDSDEQLQRFYGRPGTGQTLLQMPFPLRLAWDTEQVIERVSCHHKVKQPLTRIWWKTLEHYGHERLRDLGLDLFGGCLNVRRKRGGSTWSVHAFGAAWDVDPERNRLRWDHTHAHLSRPEYVPFWEIVEAEGAVSLGRREDRDWMHFQFAR